MPSSPFIPHRISRLHPRHGTRHQHSHKQSYLHASTPLPLLPLITPNAKLHHPPAMKNYSPPPHITRHTILEDIIGPRYKRWAYRGYPHASGSKNNTNSIAYRVVFSAIGPTIQTNGLWDVLQYPIHRRRRHGAIPHCRTITELHARSHQGKLREKEGIHANRTAAAYANASRHAHDRATEKQNAGEIETKLPNASCILTILCDDIHDNICD